MLQKTSEKGQNSPVAQNASTVPNPCSKPFRYWTRNYFRKKNNCLVSILVSITQIYSRSAGKPTPVLSKPPSAAIICPVT